MRRKSSMIRRVLIGSAAALAVMSIAALGFAAAVDAGLFRKALVRLISVRAGRPLEVEGPLEIRLLSLHPRLSAERLVIGNPGWMPAGRTAEIGKLSLVLALPGLHHGFGIESLSMQSATLHLARDSSGRANWQWTEHARGGGEMAILRALSVPDARVQLDDARRHLQFDGTVSAETAPGSGAQPLRIEGTGRLNGREASFEIVADPLAAASHDEPYHYSFTERSSGSELHARGSLPRPFDFSRLEGTFDATGEDLRDLYFLIGVKLINTGRFRLSGKFLREGLSFKLSELSVVSGESDMRGSLSIDSSGVRPTLDVSLDSQRLRTADLGARATGRAAALEARGDLLLSNTPLNPVALRRDDWRIAFRARRLEVGSVSLYGVSARGTIDHGVFTVAPLQSDILQGKLDAHLKLDAQSDPPTADVDIKLADLQLGDLPRKGAGPAPIEGLLQARIALSGRGSSLHQVAATANGTVAALVPGGTVRDSLAELTGIDLRALGLLLTKNRRDIALRCAAVTLKDHDGTLTAERLTADTGAVLITGEGQAHLDTEALDFVIRGQPKSLRLLRFRAPLLLEGTLSHPVIRITTRRLAIIDPGRARDVDCAALAAAFDALP